jgi:hypothetical protein
MQQITMITSSFEIKIALLGNVSAGSDELCNCDVSSSQIAKPMTKRVAA